MLKSIYQKADETTVQNTFASVQQSLATMNTQTNPSLNTRVDHSDNHEGAETSPGPEEVNLEEISIHFLRVYSIHPNWKQVVSSCNDHGQTMAHISITLGYLRLLRYLSTWGINLNVADNMGLTALHYSYLFKQEECAKFLIHSGVDQFILDDLGRSPSDLDPSLGVRLRSNTDIDSDNYAEGASPIEYDNEMPDETEKLYAKHFLVRQWMRQGEDERRGEVPPSRCQSPETLGPPRSAGSPPALDSADERDCDATYDRSSSLIVRIPKENSTPTVPEEMSWESSVEVAVSPRNTPPPSPLSEISAGTPGANRPSDTGQNQFSHPAPLGSTLNTPDVQHPEIYHGTRTLRRSADRPLVQRSKYSTHTNPTPQGPGTALYTRDQLAVQRELFEAIDIRFLPMLQAIFNSEEWICQNQPIPRKLIKALYLRDSLTDGITCVFCPDVTFNQHGRIIEHLQQHLGLRPFYCTEPNWYGLGPRTSQVTIAEILLVREHSCVNTTSKVTPAFMLLPAVCHVPTTGKSDNRILRLLR